MLCKAFVSQQNFCYNGFYRFAAYKKGGQALLLDAGTQSIETARLLLRRFERGDAKNAFRHWCSDPKVTRYLKWSAHQHLLQTEQTLNYWIKEYRDPCCFHWAVTLKGTGELIGGISLIVKDRFDERAEIGYSFGSAYWGQGYGHEAAEAVLRYGFERVGFNRIEGICAVANLSSARLLEHLGLRREGLHLKMCRLSDGSFTDCYSYGLLAEDYFRSRQ